MSTSLKKFCVDNGPKLALISVSIIWGTTFPLGKYVIAHMPIFMYLAVRFAMATVLFLALNYRDVANATRKDWVVSCVIGVMLFAAFAFQTLGLEFTTAAKTSFVTGMYVVFVPFLYFIIFREPLRRNAVIAGILGAVGLAMLGGDFSGLTDWDFGVTLVMISGFFTALQIVGIARYAQTISPVVMSVLQIGVVAVLCGVVAIFTETWPGELDITVWLTIVFLAVFATIFAYYVQCKVQQSINHTATAVILSMECVFGGLFSWLFLGEPFTLLMLIGGTLLVFAMIIAQWEKPAAE